MSEPGPSGDYIHGSHPEEQRRLSGLNEWLNRRCLEELDLQPADRVLDLGCGLGQLSRAMGRAVQPGGRVVAVERDPNQLRKARRLAEQAGEAALVEFRAGDASSPPLEPEERGRFDVAHCRFLLEHLLRPGEAVAAMAAALRPGGRLVLMDDDHELFRFSPPRPRLERLWNAYLESYRALGNDPAVGRRLVTLLYEAGARPHRTTFVPYAHCQGSDGFEAAVENVIGVIRSALPTMRRFGLLEAGELEAAFEDYREWARLPDAAFWYCLNWAEGRVT